MEKSFQIESWTKEFMTQLSDTFGNRLLFFGLQGSYGRGEATDKSDIDVVVILDQLTVDDLLIYKSLLNDNSEKDRICGFVAGKKELIHWAPFDLLQLYLDTHPLMGTLKELEGSFSKQTCYEAIHSAACNLYHATSHNYLHAEDSAMLHELYKSARFIVRMKHYSEQGTYIPQMELLQRAVSAEDRQIIAYYSQEVDTKKAAFEEGSRYLIEWSSRLIEQFDPSHCITTD